LGLKDLSESIDEQSEVKKGGGAEKSFVALAIEQFKHTDRGKGHSIVSQSAGEGECPDKDDVQESRKRKITSKGLPSYLNYFVQCILRIK
jgi:hypothetical protein